MYHLNSFQLSKTWKQCDRHTQKNWFNPTYFGIDDFWRQLSNTALVERCSEVVQMASTQPTPEGKQTNPVRYVKWKTTKNSCADES